MPKFLRVIQFPWRMLGITTLCIVVAGALIIGEYIKIRKISSKGFFENNKIIIVLCVATLILVPLFLSDFSKRPVFMRQNDIVDNDMTFNGEYYLINTNTEEIIEDKNPTYHTHGNVKVLSYKRENLNTYVEYENEDASSYIELPLLYYPVYYAIDENGKDIKLSIGENNVIRIELDEIKTGKITVSSRDRGGYVVADIISLLTFITLIRICNLYQKKRP